MSRRLLGLTLFLAIEPAAPALAQGGEDPGKKPEIVLSTEWDDRRAGEEAAKEVDSFLGLVKAPALEQYVAAVGRRVALHALGGHFDYRFQIVDQEAPNAFALPGGYIFVSRGLLALANSEDELANVLAHEVVHVASRHAAARQHIVRGVPGLLQWLQIGDLAAYGRDQERVADRLGQEVAAAAGYDPKAMASFLRSLEFAERLRRGASRLPSFLDTHPATGQRVGDAHARAEGIAWTAVPGIAPTREDFLHRLDGLVLGMSAAEGVFRRERFLHPDLGFSLRFPEGWETENTRTAVGARAPDRSAALALEGGGHGVSVEEAAARYLEKAVSEGFQLVEAGPVPLRGALAYRAVGLVGSPGGTLRVWITWIAHGDDVYRLVGTSLSKRHEPVFLAVARSFQPLPPEALSGFEEQRLRLATAEPDEAFAALALRTRNRWDVQQTAVMNGLHADQPLAGGQLLKIALLERYEPHKEEAQ
jgi:predicted Zn-dependent protease